MESQEIAKRYGAALFGLADERGVLEEIGKDFDVLSALLEDSADFAAFVQNPAIPEDKQADVIGQIAASAHEISRNGLLLLVRKNRLVVLPELCADIAERLNERNNIVDVTITSAVSMSDEQVKALCDKLEQRLGKTIRPRLKQDATLIGGFRLRIGDLIEDYSLQTKLNTFKQNVLNA